MRLALLALAALPRAARRPGRTDYPDFHPGDRAQVLPNGKVAPM